MLNTILIILAVVVGIILVMKFIRYVIKGIIFLALLAVIFVAYKNVTNSSTAAGNSPPAVAGIQASVQNEADTAAHKFLGSSLEQIETNLQNTVMQGISSVKKLVGVSK